MVAAELRGGNKPSLNEALRWIGSRVDDIYGADVGRLEDVWIDPGTGVPRWLLVKEGRFGGRTTLIPFEDATAGAGHVWVPYEGEVVGGAPEIEPGAPLTQQVEASLRSHYAANAPASIAQRGGSTPPLHRDPQAGSGMATPAIRFAGAPQDGSRPALGFDPPRPAQAPPQAGVAPDPPSGPRRHILRNQSAPHQPAPDPAESATVVRPRMPERPAPPVHAPAPQPRPQPTPQQPAVAPQAPGFPPQQPGIYEPPQTSPPAYALPPQRQQPVQGWQPTQPAQPPPAQWTSQPQPSPEGGPAWQETLDPDPGQAPVEALRSLAEADGTHFVEIELSGELIIRGELRSVRITPRPDSPPQR